MRLKVIRSGSGGNCYLLTDNSGETLMLEAGVHIREIKKALNYKVDKVIGCLMTHSHLDHAVSALKVLGCGIDLYSTLGTHNACMTAGKHNAFHIDKKTLYSVGDFEFMAFESIHPAADPVNFFLNHEEMGPTIFATDTMAIPETFAGLTNIIIEANYCEDHLAYMNQKGLGNSYVNDRVALSHMSVQKCIDTLNGFDLKKVNKIVLIHLSNTNADAKKFKRMVEEATRKEVFIAEEGLDIDFNISPF